MMNRKKGNTKSQGVNPFHAECSSISNESPLPLFTKIIPATVIPRSTSSDNSLLLSSIQQQNITDRYYHRFL